MCLLSHCLWNKNYLWKEGEVKGSRVRPAKTGQKALFTDSSKATPKMSLLWTSGSPQRVTKLDHKGGECVVSTWQRIWCGE